ncbi:MAG: helix-turn-helix transcriptional regulator [Oscillospiraceae bacterium]|nr:helix-turn-helix transcriptional regulator [Oscillospiraceae bacterium]
MNITICENLKQLRRKKNDTQDDLAEFLNVSSAAVSKWERGECYPDIELIPRIASYYDVTLDDLFGMNEMKKNERVNEYIAKNEDIWVKEKDKSEQARKKLHCGVRHRRSFRTIIPFYVI